MRLAAAAALLAIGCGHYWIDERAAGPCDSSRSILVGVFALAAGAIELTGGIMLGVGASTNEVRPHRSDLVYLPAP